MSEPQTPLAWLDGEPLCREWVWHGPVLEPSIAEGSGWWAWRGMRRVAESWEPPRVAYHDDLDWIWGNMLSRSRYGVWRKWVWGMLCYAQREHSGCPLCDGLRPKQVIDHDHESGEVRGLLCRVCNQVEGLMKRGMVPRRMGRVTVEDVAALQRRFADYRECPPAHRLPFRVYYWGERPELTLEWRPRAA